MENSALLTTPLSLTHTRLDDNIDQLYMILLSKGVTLEKAMQVLQEIKQAMTDLVPP